MNCRARAGLHTYITSRSAEQEPLWEVSTHATVPIQEEAIRAKWWVRGAKIQNKLNGGLVNIYRCKSKAERPRTAHIRAKKS
jgi:hypothetical protein